MNNNEVKVDKILYEINNYINNVQGVKNIDNFIRFTSSVRLMLHNHIYNNPDNINKLINHFNIIDLFNIDYDSINKTLQLKIKKTNMKKYPNYIHNVSFYYSIFNQILHSFLYEIYNQLEYVIDTEGVNYGVACEVNYILDNRVISMIYNITTILDNIVFIHL